MRVLLIHPDQMVVHQILNTISRPLNELKEVFDTWGGGV